MSWRPRPRHCHVCRERFVPRSQDDWLCPPHAQEAAEEQRLADGWTRYRDTLPFLDVPGDAEDPELEDFAALLFRAYRQGWHDGQAG